jgi:cytochrome c553
MAVGLMLACNSQTLAQGSAEAGQEKAAPCVACHGPAGRGNSLATYPVVRGQHATYVVNTLHAYASGDRRSDGAINQMMRDIAITLRDDEMQAVASYMQGLR